MGAPLDASPEIQRPSAFTPCPTCPVIVPPPERRSLVNSTSETTEMNALPRDMQKCGSVIVLSSYVRADPSRATFYSEDLSKDYECIESRPHRRTLLGRLRSSIATALKVGHRVLIRPPTAIVVEDPRIGITSCLLIRFLRTRASLIVWNYNMLSPYRGLKRWLSRIALSRADAIIVYSKHEKALYSKQLRLPEGKFRFKLYSGPYLDDDRYRALSSEKKEAFVVSPGFSGRDFILLSQVASCAPELRFIVLAYPTALAGIKFPENVEVRHGLSELEYCRYIARAQVCFLPLSNMVTANGHIAIVQAMSLGTLLVTNLTPGTSDYIKDRENCITFSGNDAEHIARSLKYIMEQFEDYTGVIVGARLFAEEHFSVRRDIEMIDAILSER